MSGGLNYCDCGDYCEWCHPKLVYRRENMTNEFRDDLIKWLECRIKKSKNVYEVYAYREVIAFVKTEGKLK